MKTSIFFLFFLLCSFSFLFDFKVNSFSELNSGSTFVKTYGQTNVDENALAMTITPEGNFLIGGNQANNSLLVYLDAEGELIWQRTIDFLPQDDDIYDIQIDVDGFVIGNVRYAFNGVNTTVLFKYDYLNDNLIWTKNFPNPEQSRFYSFIEKPNGNYLFFGRVQPVNSCDAAFFEIDRNTGNQLSLKGFSLDNCEIFIHSILAENSIFSAGRYTYGGVGVADFRASISRFDLNGNEIWTKIYNAPANSIARTYMDYIIEDNGQFLAVGRGDLNGTEFENVSFFIYNIDPDNGNINWAKKYDIPSSTSTHPKNLIPLSDGYLLPGEHNSNGNQDYFLLKVDKEGNPIWSKSYKLDGNQQNWFLHRDNHIFFSATIQNPNGSDTDLGFGKLNMDGSLDNDSCEIVEPIIVEVTDYSNCYSESINLTDYSLNEQVFSQTNNSQNVMLETKEICSSIPLTEDCFNNIDDNGNGLTDCEDVECFCENECRLLAISNPLNLPDELEIPENEPYVLNTQVNNEAFIENITWLPENIFSCQNCLNPILSISNPLSIQAIITDINGCTYTQSLFVNIIDGQNCDQNLAIPNVFSPNDDGINDTFKIPENQVNWIVISIKIFNRWGGLVFESNDPHFQWDGNLNGKSVANDVYVYLINAQCNNNLEVFSGDLTVLR